MSFYRNQLEDWLKTIEVQCSAVLDIGGGEKPVKDRLKLLECKTYKILDNDASFSPDYFVDLNYIYDVPKNFDVAFCLEVFEYVWNPVQAIENIYAFLGDSGISYISFPSIYPVHNPQAIDYLRYTKSGIEKLLAIAGFTGWEITAREATIGKSYLSDFYRVEGMHPVKDKVVYDIGYLVKAVKS